MEKGFVNSQDGKDGSDVVLTTTYPLHFYMEIWEKAIAVQVCQYCSTCWKRF